MIDQQARNFMRCRKICCEMLNDRGYNVNEDEQNDNYNDFLRRFEGHNRQKANMIIIGIHKNNPNDQIIVYFNGETKKTGIKSIKDLSDMMEERKLTKAIMVGQTGITNYAASTIKELGPIKKIEYFLENELLVNITKHKLVPRHIPLTEDQKQEVLRHYKISDILLPRILQKDPIARYYGLKRGDVVKIIRPSESAGRYVTYRLCC